VPDPSSARILFVMTTRTYRATAFLEAAQKLGIAAVVGSEARHLLSDLNPAGYLQLDFQDLEGATDRIVEYDRSYPLQAVVSPDDDGLVLAAMASDALRLSHNAVWAVRATRDKYRMRQVLQEAGLPSPWFERFAVDEDPTRISGLVPYPCVVKPLALSGSRGVIRANNPDEFSAAFHRIRNILGEPDAALQSGPLGAYILVEGYIPGEELALEGLVTDKRLNVLAIFDKPDPLVGPYFEETIYLTPSCLPYEIQQKVKQTAATASAVLGITQGPIHIEMRLDGSSVTIVEIAPRSIGGYCSRALRFGSQISLEELILRQALGENVENYRRESEASGVMMIPTPASGTLSKIDGLDKARQTDGISELVVSIPLGAELHRPPEGSQYLGFIFARGPEPGRVEAALRAAHSHLHFSIEVESNARK
jgi:biotin carboxylase